MLRRYLRSIGSCIGYHSRGSRGSVSSDENPTMFHNRPLKNRKPKWKSNIRLTETQLKAKREEFWDTAPAFEGRREIWDALKASVSALESGDYQMAQVILDGASISLPNGTLMDCYDELGNRYQLPVYILSVPINIIREGDEREEEEEEEMLKKKAQGNRKREQEGKQINIRIRFSTGEDRKLTVNTSESVAAIKRSLARCTPGIDPNTVRFFFAGKQLYNKMSLASAKIESNYTIQALIYDHNTSSIPTLQAVSAEDNPVWHQLNSKDHKLSPASSIQHLQKTPVMQTMVDTPENEEESINLINKNNNYSFENYNIINNLVNNDYDDINCKYKKIKNKLKSSINQENSSNVDPKEQQQFKQIVQPEQEFENMEHQPKIDFREQLEDGIQDASKVISIKTEGDQFAFNGCKYNNDIINYNNNFPPISLDVEGTSQHLLLKSQPQ